jgi:hypothetical protein
MTKIKTLLNDRGQAKTGLVSVNSYNVDPTTRVALATTGLLLNAADFIKYDFLTVDQTSADTDIIKIPAGLPVGSKMAFQSTDVVALMVSTGETHNGAAATTAVATVAGALTVYTKLTATAWIVTNYAAAGTVTAPTPA